MLLNEDKCLLKIKELSEQIYNNCNLPDKVEKYASSIINILSIIDTSNSSFLSTGKMLQPMPLMNKEIGLSDVKSSICFNKAIEEQDG